MDQITVSIKARPASIDHALDILRRSLNGETIDDLERAAASHFVDTIGKQADSFEGGSRNENFQAYRAPQLEAVDG